MGGAFFSFPYHNIGTMDATAGAADAVLGVSERSRGAIDALDNGLTYDIPQGVNALEIRFIGTTNGDNHVMDLWMGKNRSGTNPASTDMCRMCTLDVETGTQAVTEDGGATLLYADEATLSNEAWAKDLQVIQSANDSELMVRLYISDTCGYDVIGFHGHTTFANDLQVEVSGFSSYFE
jgi:hypothetical protein